MEDQNESLSLAEMLLEFEKILLKEIETERDPRPYAVVSESFYKAMLEDEELLSKIDAMNKYRGPE